MIGLPLLLDWSTASPKDLTQTDESPMLAATWATDCFVKVAMQAPAINAIIMTFVDSIRDLVLGLEFISGLYKSVWLERSRCMALRFS